MRLIELERPDARAHIAPDEGGRLAQLSVRMGDGWHELLWPQSGQVTPVDPLAWGCYAMLPWPNRIANGHFSFAGADVGLMPGAYSLPTGHAIHGLGFARAWTVEEHTGDACSMALDLAGLWPFGGEARQRVALLDDGIELVIELRSTGARFPAGAGWHPWFRRDVIGRDGPRVRVDSPVVYQLEADGIPTGTLVDVDEAHDLRNAPPLGDRRIDACYSAVNSSIIMTWGGLELRMASSENVRHAVIYTPGHAFCVEPQTCAIDAFNLSARGVTHTGVAVVEPSRPLIASTRWTWSHGDPAVG